MFEEAAPLLFGVSFEKKMREHLESLIYINKSSQWAQKVATEVTSFFEGATASTRLGAVAAPTEEEADRDSSLTLTKQVEERCRPFQRKEQQAQQK